MRRLILAASLSMLAAPALAQPAPETRTCIDNREIRNTRLDKDSGLYVRAVGGWWRNKAGNCPVFRPNTAIRSTSTLNRKCENDVIVVFDPLSQMELGACTLDKWEKVADDAVPKGN